MKLLEVYKAILNYASMKTDKNGFVKNGYENENNPILVDGKQLVLPYSEQLKNFNPDEKIVFHPMAENIFRGESEIITLLKQKISIKINISTSVLITSLTNILASPDLHAQLNPQQAELFKFPIETDLTSLKNMIRVVTTAIKSKSEKTFVYLYINKGGTYKAQRYSRVGVTIFPLYEQLLSETPNTGVLNLDYLRAKDKICLKYLLEYIFPNINEKEEYNFGSHSSMAPYLDSLLMTSAKIAARINDMLELYSSYIEDVEKYTFPSDWLDDVKDMDTLKNEIRRIPVQHGNDGSLTVAAPPVEKEPLAQAAQISQPIIQQTQSQQSTNGKVSFNDLFKNGQVQNNQQPQYPNQPQMPVQQQFNPNQIVGYNQQGFPVNAQGQIIGQPLQQPYGASVYQHNSFTPPQQQYPLLSNQPSAGGWPQPPVTGQPMYPNQHNGNFYR